MNIQVANQRCGLKVEQEIVRPAVIYCGWCAENMLGSPAGGVHLFFLGTGLGLQPPYPLVSGTIHYLDGKLTRPQRKSLTQQYHQISFPHIIKMDQTGLLKFTCFSFSSTLWQSNIPNKTLK